MKKQLIYFDKEAYQYAASRLEKLVNTINQMSEEMSKEDIILTPEDLEQIAKDRKAYNNKHYLDELKKVCDMFSLDFDKVKTIDYFWQNPMFSDMANKRAKPYYQVSNVLANILFNAANIVKYIDLKDNIASPKISAFEDLKKEYSYYTENERQNEVCNRLKVISDLVNQLETLGFDKRKLVSAFYADNNINPYYIKTL